MRPHTKSASCTTEKTPRSFCLALALFIPLMLASCSAKKPVQSPEPAAEPQSREEVPADRTEQEEAPLPEEEPVEEIPPLEILSVDAASRCVRPSQFIAEENNLYSWNSIYDSTDIFPIGFSKDGAFAFILTTSYEGKGSTALSFVIADLVEDETLWSVTEDDENFPGSGSSLSQFISRNHGSIDAALKEHRITDANVPYLPFPVQALGTTFTVEVRETDTGRRELEYLKVIDYSCVAVRADGAEKTITSRTDEMVEKVFVCGAFKSPHEERLAVVIAEERMGFEGFDLHYSVLGCSLTAGFKAAARP